MAVVVLLADGVRPDTLTAAMDAGAAPALNQLRREGSLRTVTTCFPSVTGPAYTPVLMGRFPGGVGLPGIRWLDRSRRAASFPGYARSYTGYQLGRIDRDLDSMAPTIFELAGHCVGALGVINRGLEHRRQIGRIWGFRAARAAAVHFTGNVRASLGVDREVADATRAYVRARRPDFAFAAFGAMDKCAHAFGHESADVREALRTVDRAAADIRADAEEDGRWDDMHLWITSDHGHAPVTAHHELARFVAECGFRVLAHPLVAVRAPEVAVMVSGNAMAHLYVEPSRRERPLWPDTGTGRWGSLVDALVAHPSVDVMLLPTADGAVVRSAAGEAVISRQGDGYSYRRTTGDPLGVGRDVRDASDDEVYDATIGTEYPDSIVQIAALATAPRSGDIILSASPGWDFRKRFEPIDHVSTHGGLRRDQMLVPLLLNRPLAPGCVPRRTADVMPSVLAALGVPVPHGLDGRAFMATFPL